MKNKLIGGGLLSTMVLSLLAGCGPKPTIGDPEPAPKPDHSYVEIPKMDENNISPDEKSELTVHYLPEGYAIAVSSGQAALLFSSYITPTGRAAGKRAMDYGRWAMGYG